MSRIKATRASRIPMVSLTVLALAAALPGAAHAQDGDGKVSEEQAKEIIVTGTLLRGTAPVGSNSIALGQTKIEETGAISSNELLASIPQVTNYFNRVPVADLGIAVNQIQVSRPNLRNISPNNASSAATLILVDGHRIATAGVNQASVDPDLIPTGAIERVEVVTEGGSATYGADAVAGVINFITRKRFDGLKAEAHYGFAKDYWQWDANVTAGKTWDTGSAYVSYTYNKSDALYGRDRSYIHNLDYSAQPYVGRDLTCVSPNLSINTVYVPAGVTLSSVNYAAPGYAANTYNRCDNSQNSTVVPRAERHGVFAGLTQDLGDHSSLDVKAYYGQRQTRSSSVLTGTVTVGANNYYAPSYLPAGITLGGTVISRQAAVSFSLQPVYGLDSQHSDTLIKEWGANAELKHQLSETWQVRALANWSASDSSYDLTGLSNTRLAAAGSGTTAATAINPFEIAKTSRALLDDLIDSEIAGQAKDSLFNLRLVTDGTLMTLPGGEARVAVGYEYMHDKLEQRFQNDIRIGTLRNYNFTPYSRDVHSLFGELQLPLIGNGQGGSMLTVSASGRYDHYSDFGDTFNPKLGATFKPASWIALRGNWGTSFTAPTPLDQLGSQRNTISAFSFVAFTRPGDTVPGGSYTVALQGSQPNLKPQKADTWSVGIDLDPLAGLHASVNYFDVNFKDILRTPTPGVGIFTEFPGNIATNTAGLTTDQLRAFAALAPNGSAVIEPLIASGTRVYELVDFRTGNFGILHVKGIDFALNYQRSTGFGSVDFAVNGNIPLSRKQQASPTAAVSDVLATETPKLTMQTQLGLTSGGLRAQATWNHTSGYAIPATTSVPVQTRVGSFDTVNLFFKYDVGGKAGWAKDLSFTLNVSNVFDQNPPVLLRNNQGELGYANGFTLGRMFILGVAKKF